MADEDQAPRVWWSRLVRDADQIVGPARAVCWFLADVADKNGASWYGQKRIALHAGVTDRTVRNVLDDLVSKGVIRVDPPAEGHRCPTTTLIAAGLERWKGIPVRAESGSTQRGKGFRPKRKRVPIEAETDSYEVPKKSPEEDPKEVITEGPTAREPNPALLTDEQPEPPMHSLLYERVIPGIVTGSKPTTDTDPIDNGGDKTSHPESAGPLSPLPDRIERGTASAISIPIEPHADEVTDATPLAADPGAPLRADDARQPAPGSGVVGVAGVVGDRGGDGVRAGGVDRLAGEVTAGAAPATGPLFAPPAPTISGVAPDSGQAVASKPKRGKGKQADETIAAIAAQVDRMMGRTGAALPGSGRWKQIVSAVNEAGAARVLARVTAMADAAQGLPSPAAAIFAAMAGSEYGTGPILRGHNGWTVKLDDALDASAFGEKRASEKPGDVGRVDSRPSGANAPQASQAVSWPDVLRDLGSDPQHHPDDGPHREAWQRVRQAVLVSTRKAGDPWITFCNADDRTRQHVERLLVGGLVR